MTVQPSLTAMDVARPLRARDRKWLAEIKAATDAIGLGMYRGMTYDSLPSGPAHRLCHVFGYITTYEPHNSVHKTRWVITIEGRAALKARTGKGE